MCPSGSNEFEASSVTSSFAVTVWSGPASATGASLVTWMTTESVFVLNAGFGFWLSVTESTKVKSTGPSFGAVNVGCAACESESVTVVPKVCVHV